MDDLLKKANALLTGGLAPKPHLMRNRLKMKEGQLLDLMALARLTAGKSLSPFTCGIINIKSGRCGEDCSFCSQSSHYNSNVVNYPMMGIDGILRRLEALLALGVRYVGLVASGGQLNDRDFSKLLRAARVIGTNYEVKLCASIGFLDESRAAQLKEAGFCSCHHNLEAAPDFFPKLCGSHSFEARIDTIKIAKKAGLRVCSGGIFGAGESWEHRLDLALLLKELEVDSTPLNFLMPIEGTPLGEREPLSPAEALRIIALFRLVNSTADLVICGGRELALKSLKSLVFSAGANGIMIGDYLTAKGSLPDSDLMEMAALELR